MNVNHDGKLLIAVGRSRKSAQWQNKELNWSELLDKFATTTRTRETAAEYAALPKGERDTIKDVGGFVGGYLKNGRRSNASVVNRCLVCLDADYADEDLLDDLDLTFIDAYALYSTHSHTAEKMRLRLIIPLARTVTPDESAGRNRMSTIRAHDVSPSMGRSDASTALTHDEHDCCKALPSFHEAMLSFHEAMPSPKGVVPPSHEVMPTFREAMPPSVKLCPFVLNGCWCEAPLPL